MPETVTPDAATFDDATPNAATPGDATPDAATPGDALPGEATPVFPELVAGRECGSCNVCCVALTIDDPALQKVQGYRCPNTLPDKGCAIYEARPHTCRTFYCGWRRLKWVRQTLRPDRSGVLVRLHNEVSTANGTRRMGVAVTLLDNAALKADGLAETVAAAVAAGVPTFLHVPGPPGYTAGMAKINDVLEDAVFARDKPAVLRILRQARARGRSGDHKPIVLTRRKNGGAALPEPPG